MYYVYLLVYGDENKQKYIGYTSDLKRRFSEHKREKENCKLVYYEAYPDEDMARERERSIKGSGSIRKSLYKRLKLL
jgi:predicted GIY-YIG superfamily endonuclease